MNMYWQAVQFALTLVVALKEIPQIICKDFQDEYFHYNPRDSDHDFMIDYASEPSYVRDMYKFPKMSKTGIRYDYKTIPVPVYRYYPVHISEPAYEKTKYSYPKMHPSNKKKSSKKSHPKKKKQAQSPKNQTSSTEPRASSLASKYKSLPRKSSNINKPVYRNKQPAPIPFKNLEPEFTTPVPAPPTSRKSRAKKVTTRIPSTKETVVKEAPARPVQHRVRSPNNNDHRPLHSYHQDEESSRRPQSRKRSKDDDEDSQHRRSQYDNNREYHQQSRPHSPPRKSQRQSNPPQYQQHRQQPSRPQQHSGNYQSDEDKRTPRRRGSMTNEKAFNRRPANDDSVHQENIPKDKFHTIIASGDFGNFKKAPGSFRTLINSDNSFLHHLEPNSNEQRNVNYEERRNTNPEKRRNQNRPTKEIVNRGKTKEHEEEVSDGSSEEDYEDLPPPSPRSKKTRVYYDDITDRESSPSPRHSRDKIYDNPKEEAVIHNKRTEHEEAYTPSQRSNDKNYQEDDDERVERNKHVKYERSQDNRNAAPSKYQDSPPVRHHSRDNSRRLPQKETQYENSYRRRPDADEEEDEVDYRDSSSDAVYEEKGKSGNNKNKERNLRPVKINRGVVYEEHRPVRDDYEQVESKKSETVVEEEKLRTKRDATVPILQERKSLAEKVIVSSSNPSTVKIFKALRLGKSDKDVILVDSRITRDKNGYPIQVITKTIPVYTEDELQMDLPACAKNQHLHYCIDDGEYPEKDIMEALRSSNKYLETIVSEPETSKITQEEIEIEDKEEQRCQSNKSLIYPLRAKDVGGTWRIIVNVRDVLQPVYLETCRNCNSEEADQTNCEQEETERKLLTFDGKNSSLSVQNFKFSGPCVCIQSSS